MAVVVLKVPKSNLAVADRAGSCPYCGSQVIQRWGSLEREVQDIQAETVGVSRYLCSTCGHTFRFYPAGMDRSTVTPRIRRLGAIACVLGMSYREAEAFFAEFNIYLGRMTLWRDTQELLKRVDGQSSSPTMPKFSIDTIYKHRISNRLGVVVALNLNQDNFKVLGTIDEINPLEVKRYLELLTQGSGIEVTLIETGYLDPMFTPGL